MNTIALISDFGLQDWFVGSMKGAIVSHNESARIIDVTHSLPRGDIGAASVVTSICHRDFPKGTAFVIVVDPGVGSARALLAAYAGGYIFVAPDNGILTPILQQYEEHTLYKADPQAICPATQQSSTFHGRDLFAPLGACLARGDSPHIYGSRTTHYIKARATSRHAGEDSISGTIVYIDVFGNAITSVPGNALSSLNSSQWQAIANGFTFGAAAYYSEKPQGNALALVSSGGYVELAVNGGSAAQRFGLRPGIPVCIEPQGETNTA